MRTPTWVLLVAVVSAGCGGAGDASGGAPSVATAVTSTTVTTSVPSAAVTGDDVVPNEEDRQPAVIAPEYDVFLAAVAETVEGTVFEGIPFDDPELTVATGLLLCERLAEGADLDEIVVDYLAELTDGDIGSADDDQLTLTGALVGAATEALCPELKNE